MKKALKIIGIIFLAIIIIIVTAILTGYFYGESNVKYLFKTNHVLFLVRIIVIVVIIISACASAGLIWSLVDIGVGFTATINIIALCYLASEVKKRLRKLP